MRIVSEHIYKSFPSKKGELEVLEDINFSTEEHDFVCILGGNGCGKTTLLKIMARILEPTKGRVQYLSDNGSPAHASLIYQGEGLFPWLNVMDNACFGLEMRGMPKKERYGRALCIIEKMGLKRFADFYPHQLSAGMKQKVNLIRGLLMDSPVLLIDEPSTSLDATSKLLIREDIYKVWKDYQKTVIYVTHDVEEALQLARHIWVMGKYPGKIIKKFDNIPPYAPDPGARARLAPGAGLKDQILEIIGGQPEKNILC